MIRTDKYKKGVIALTLKAAELNPLLGTYEAHYINENARFIVQLTNGKLEIDIELARECEENNENILYGKIRKVAFSYRQDEGSYKYSSNIDTAWKKLFTKTGNNKPQ